MANWKWDCINCGIIYRCIGLAVFKWQFLYNNNMIFLNAIQSAYVNFNNLLVNAIIRFAQYAFILSCNLNVNAQDQMLIFNEK